jgi:hypothetical protein
VGEFEASFFNGELPVFSTTYVELEKKSKNKTEKETKQNVEDKDKEDAGSNGRAVWDMYCFRPLENWDCGFESHSKHEYVYAFFCVVLFCVGRGLASGRSPVQGVLPTVQIDSQVSEK